MPKLSRRHFLLSSFLAAGGYSTLIEPALLRIREKTLLIPNLPATCEGFKVAHLTDFHYDPMMKSLIRRAVKKTNEWQPDLIALTGDFIDQRENHLEELLDALSALEARLGSYAVLGNHDHHHRSPNQFKEAFSNTPVRLLVNEIDLNDELEIIGLDSIYSSTPDFTLPVGERNRFRLLLAHEPDTFDQTIPAYSPHLQLSGHTHGGQCRVPFIGYAPFVPKYGRKYKDGEFYRNGSSLFVSSGLGTSIAPLRFACLPEVALLTLKKA